MPSKLRADMLRPLTLSPDETQMIIADAERILTESLAASELFVAHNRTLPTSHWKLVKQKESVQVFRARKHPLKPLCETAVAAAAVCPLTARVLDSVSSVISSSNSSSRSYCRSRSDSVDKNSSTYCTTDTLEFTHSGKSTVSIDSTDSDRSDSNSSSNVYNTQCSSEAASSRDSRSSSRAATSTHPQPLGRPTSTTAAATSACDRMSHELNQSNPADRPLVIASGIVPGHQLEDVAFGSLAHTEELWRYRDVHMGATQDDVKILATITRPTPTHPFQSLTIKWATRRSVGPLARRRDCVYLEANGLAVDAHGDRVAFNLSHSLDTNAIARIPSFKHLDVVRVHLSMCFVTRKYDDTSLEVFCRGFADIGGSIVDSMANAVFTDMVLSVVHVVDCAYVKKLIWLGYRKRRQQQQTNANDVMLTNGCANCGGSLAVVGGLFGSKGSMCRACRRAVCCKCRVDKKVVLPVGDGGNSFAAKTKRVPFCLHCVVEATQAPTHDVAATMVSLMASQWEWHTAIIDPDMSA